MKKALVILLGFSLVVGALVAPAPAAKKKKKPKRVERTVESKYEAPAIGTAQTGNGVCFRPTNSCGDIATAANEAFVMVEIADRSGTKVGFSLGQDTDPNTFGTEKDLGDFCGATAEPVAIEPGLPIVVFPWMIGSTSCPGIATQGTVTATLSNLP